MTKRRLGIGRCTQSAEADGPLLQADRKCGALCRRHTHWQIKTIEHMWCVKQDKLSQSKGGFFLQNAHAMFFSGFYILSVCTFMQSYSIIPELFVFLVCCCCRCLKYNRDMQYNARPWLEMRTVTLLTSFTTNGKEILSTFTSSRRINKDEGRRTKRPTCSLFSETY